MNTTSHRNIKRFLVAASVALAVPLSALALPGHANDHGGCGAGSHGGTGPHAMGGDMMPPYLRGLNLSEAQRDKVFEIMHAQAPVMRDRAKALRKLEDELRGLTMAPDYSEARARSLAEAAAKAMAEMTMARVKTDRQVFEVLTPEQRKPLAEKKPGGDSPRGITPGG